MKNTLFLFIFFTGNVLFAQQSDNRFSQSEQNNNEYVESSPAAEDDLDGPSNPDGEDDDTVPIDNYIPVLLMTALGMIIYTTQKKKKLLS